MMVGQPKRRLFAVSGLVAGALGFALTALFPTVVAAQDASAEELATANNPLADMKAFNIQNYYYGKLWGVDDDISNTFWFRAAAPTGRILWRASLPVSQKPSGDTGFGDAQLFAAYIATPNPRLTLGIGPQLVLPTAQEGFGPDVWQLGFAAIAFAAPAPNFQVGGLLLWQTNVSGDPDDPSDPKPETSVLAFQPFGFWQLGGGTYLRAAPIWAFDLESDDYHIPFGFGIGKIVKAAGTVFNIFIEPQFTMAHSGDGQPAFQIYTALNMQF